MKIIQILPALKEGGVETGTIDFSLYLNDRGHIPIVISNGGPLVQTLEKNNIKHIRWPVHKKNPFIILSLAWRLKRYLENENIDILHARSRVPGWIAYFASRLRKTPFVTTCHGYYSTNLGGRAMGWGDRVIVASDVIKKHMIDDFKTPPDKIVKIARGVNLTQYEYRAPKQGTKPTIGMIGRITPIKGHPDFLRALSMLKKQNFSFKGIIIGRAKNEHTLNDLIALRDSLNLSDDVDFLGHQDNVVDHLKKIDLLVLPTTYPEAFGRVIIEAQAAGVPVIASNIGGLKEVIDDNKTGILIPPNNPEALAEKITQTIENKSETEKRILAARLKVERYYSKQHMAEATEKLYEELLNKTVKNILVIKLSSLGDMILISPSLREIKKRYPKAKLTLLTDPMCKHVVETCPYIDKIIFASKRERKYGFLSLLRKIKLKNFDLSIDFQNGYLTHLLVFLARVPKRFGFERKWGALLLNHHSISENLPPVEHQFQILKAMNIKPVSDHLEFWITTADQKKIDRLLLDLGIKNTNSLIGLNIGASWETKRWRPDYIASFCQYIHEAHQKQIILTGDHKDKAFEAEIMKQLRVPVCSAVGQTTLRELGALIKHCESFVSTDSAPLHIAAALGTPTLGLFGPTHAGQHRPPASKLLILQEKVDCGPCYRATCTHHSCMVNLKPSRVTQTFLKLLK